MTIEVRKFSYDDNSGKEAVIVKEETGYLRNKGYYVHITTQQDLCSRLFQYYRKQQHIIS